MTDERNATQRVHPLHPDNIAALGRLGFTVVATESYDKTLSEIERLRAWKAEATEVLATWENVWEALGRPGELGASKAQACLVALFPSRKPAAVTPAAPLVDALARCITRHQIGSTEPVQPPAWITAAATEIADAMHNVGWNPCPPDMTPDLIIPASTLLIELLAREADT